MLSQCMSLERVGEPLRLKSREMRPPGPGEVLLRVRACAVCRTDLHVVDGELPNLRLPIVPGHEIVGEVIETGAGVDLARGLRLGVPWLGAACGACEFCRSELENLCDSARFTGYQNDGGYAEHVLADARFCFPLPDAFDDLHAAPLLCAGVIGYRCLRMAGDARRIGIYGFGAAAHIIAQVARWQGREIYAFSRPGDEAAHEFARECGAHWTGDSGASPPQLLDAALIFAPVGDLVPIALGAIRKAGVVVCGGIHMSDIPAFRYSLLWGERVVRSVANLTRRDVREFMQVAPRVPVRTEVEAFALADANVALARLRTGQLKGAAVLVP
jgi:propanol-preferring alcohol dehydrogenase